MAQSPLENAATSEILRYDLGWKAINDLLRDGRSLSGKERNCCFLNLGNARERQFADISAACDLAYPDDGRVLALSDWDFDGDTDFWIANRSGPQFRFLKNDFRIPGPRSGFIAFYLRGTKSNKDAIGSRLTLTTDDGLTRIETLRAGEGYLSQSSKWLHFGIGSNTKASLKISWPNGTVQTFPDLSGNQRYLITEGSATAQIWKAPAIKPPSKSPLKAPATTDQTRLVLLAPIPLPDLEGLSGNIPHARLINLWASWCPACPIELSEWGTHAKEFEKAGLEIIAVNVDEVEDRSQWNALGLPFQYRHGSEELVKHFDVIQRSLLSRPRPLPVPCSFLVDSDGNLRALYKGTVTAAQLLSDTKLIQLAPAETLAAATPFPGRWIQPPGGSTPQQLVIGFLEGGFTGQAETYLKKLVSNPATGTAGLQNLLGGILLDRQEFNGAANAFRQALALDPNDRKAHLELGTLLLAAKKGELAASHFSQILSNSPNDPDLLLQLGRARLIQGDLDSARSALTKGNSISPTPGIQDALAQLAEAYSKSGNSESANEIEAIIRQTKPKENR